MSDVTTEFTAHQAECEKASGHCWHGYESAHIVFEECCACSLRRNERVTAEQGGLFDATVHASE